MRQFAADLAPFRTARTVKEIGRRYSLVSVHCAFIRLTDIAAVQGRPSTKGLDKLPSRPDTSGAAKQFVEEIEFTPSQFQPNSPHVHGPHPGVKNQPVVLEYRSRTL